MKKPMRLSAVLTSLSVLAASLLCGCQTKAPPVAVQVKPEDKVQSVRPHFPDGTVIGSVIAVDTTFNRAAVGDIPVAGIHEGDIFSFVDGNGEPFNFGHVTKVRIKDKDGAPVDAVHLIYDATRRAPQKGDVAVLAPSHNVATQPSN